MAGFVGSMRVGQTFERDQFTRLYVSVGICFVAGACLYSHSSLLHLEWTFLLVGHS